MSATPSTLLFPSIKSYKLTPCSIIQVFSCIILHDVLLSKTKPRQRRDGIPTNNSLILTKDYSAVILSRQFFTFVLIKCD